MKIAASKTALFLDFSFLGEKQAVSKNISTCIKINLGKKMYDINKEIYNSFKRYKQFSKDFWIIAGCIQ